MHHASCPVIGAMLVREGPLAGDVIRCFRYALDMVAEDFAARVGVNRVQLSRWENGHNVISGLSDLRIRLLVADELFTGHERDRLRTALVDLFQHRYLSAPSATLEEEYAAHDFPDCLSGA